MIKVVGWTNDNSNYRESSYSEEEIEAIIKDIQENGYSFSGDEQEDRDDCTPVLSNGTITHFSWRGWGGIMAKAHNELREDGQGYNYMLWYMKEYGPKHPKYPEKRPINFDEITTDYSFEVILSDEEYKSWKNENVNYFLFPQEIQKGKTIYYGDKINFIYDNQIVFSTIAGKGALLAFKDFINEFWPDHQFKGKSEKEIYEEIVKRYPHLNGVNIAKYFVLYLDNYRYGEK